MTISITLVPVTPLAAASNVSTGTDVSFTLTAGTAFNKTDISALIDSQVAISSQQFLDGVLNSTSGTGLSISSVVGLTAVLTTDQALFEAGDVSKTLVISGAANSANNGTWTVSAFTTTSQVELTRGSGSFVAETSSFTWILNNSNIFTTLGSYNFTASDIGKSITVSDSIVPGNNVEATITSVVTPHRVRTDIPGGYSGGPPAEVHRHWTLFGFVNGFTGSFSPTSLTNTTYTIDVTPPDHFLSSVVVPVHVAVSGNTVTPSDYSFTTSARPRVQSANPVIGDPFGRNIRIYFDQPMTDDAALATITNYALTSYGSPPAPPPVIPTITAVVPEAVTNPTWVDLNLDIPMTNDGQYLMTVANDNIFGIPPLSDKLDIDPYNSIQFLGFGTIPQQSVFKDNLIHTPIIESSSSISFAPTKASLRWFPTGAGGSLLFTAKVAGTHGNSITIWLKDPEAANQPLGLVSNSTNFTVLLATNSAGTVVTRLQDVVTLMTTQTSDMDVLAGGNINSLVVPMSSASALSGGAKMDTSTTVQIVQNDATDPTLGSLDPDVVSITLGPSSVGVVSLSDFVNNGDGSGTFKVVFSSLLTSYKLSIIAIDNVDNISEESNILSIEVLPETIPGLELSIAPYRSVYADVCDRLLDDIPQSLFTLKETYTVPYTYDPFPFTLNVVEVGMPVYITVTQDTIQDKPQSLLFTYIPQSLREVVSLPLGRGRNYLFATDGVRTAQIVVGATTYATVLCSVSTEIFDFSRLALDEVSLSIFNNLATRLAEPYLSIYEVLPSVRPQQLLSTKLAIRSYVSTKGQQRSVQDLVTAMTLQTPIVNNNLSDRTYFEPSTSPLFNVQESFAGSDVHVWLHNTCAARWLGFIKYLRNLPDVFRLLEVDDSEVVFVDDVGVTRKHKFNLLDPACSTLDLGNFCFENIVLSITSHMDTRINICAASYPRDLCFGPDNPLGPRGLFDTGIPWDSNLPFDNMDYLSEGYLDPGNDGWAGFCITPHMDSEPQINAVPPREYDPILGEIVIDGASVFGSGTHFTSYVHVGSRVYIRNENVAYTVLGVISDTELLLDAAPPPRPLSGINATLTHPVLVPALGAKEFLVSGLGTLGASDLPQNTPVHFFGPIVDTANALTVPVDVILDSGTGTSIAATGPTLTAVPLFDVGIQIAKTSETTATFTSLTPKFTSNVVGKLLYITGATNSTNNGPKLITEFVNSTNVTLSDPVEFINETTAAAIWQIYRFSPSNIGQTIRISGSAFAANNGFKLITGFSGPPASMAILTAGIDNVVATISVNDTTDYPAVGVIFIDSEEISYTGTTPTSFTGCTRGINGTTAASHLADAFVVGPTRLTLAGTFITDLSSFSWALLPAHGRLLADKPLFRATDVGKSITIANAPNSENDGTHVITNVNPPAGYGVSLVGSGATTTLTISQPFFEAEDAAKTITLSGAVNSANNGTWSITTVVSDTQVTLTRNTGSFVAEVSSFVWTFPGTSSGLSFSVDFDGSFSADNATLTLALTSGATTVLVNSTVGYDSAGTIVVDTEKITYTGTTLTSFTGCTRGTGGSTAAPHIINSIVTQPFSVDFNIEPVVGFVTSFVSSGVSRVSFPNFMPLTKSFYWYLNPRTDLKLLSGIPLDSLGDQAADKLLGNVYILETTMPPQSNGQPEVPFYVTGLDTEFLNDIEVGFPVYFPDDPSIVYKVLAIDSDTRMQIVKTLPANTINPPVVIPPHVKVIPIASGADDSTLVVDTNDGRLATFTAPAQIFTVPSVGKYINFPDKYGFGVSLALGGTLTVATPSFSLGDVGTKTVTISGAVTAGNNGVKSITNYFSSTQVELSGIVASEPAFPNNNFLWQVHDISTTTSKRLSKIVGLVGSAPTDQVLVTSLDNGIWVDSSNDFVWELLPESILVSEKADPVCVYEDGYRTVLATLCSADVDLTQYPATPDIFLSLSNTEDVTVDSGLNTIEIEGLAGAAGSRPYFLTTDVGNNIALSSGPNLGPYTITAYINPTTVEVSGSLTTDGPTSRTWTLTNT